jgi:hypothetical protein
MFNKLKSIFTGGEKAPQESAPTERIFTDAEAQAIDIAHKAVHVQLMLGRAGIEGDASCKIYRERQVTPWVIGYMVGILDDATRCTERRDHADFDVVLLFLKLHFAADVLPFATNLFLAVQVAMRDGTDWKSIVTNYRAGAQAGFETMPRNEGEAPKMALYHFLTGEGV